MKTLRKPSLAASFLVSSVLAGCAVAPPEPPEDAVRQRAQQWLDALMDFDIEGYLQVHYSSLSVCSFRTFSTRKTMLGVTCGKNS